MLILGSITPHDVLIVDLWLDRPGVRKPLRLVSQHTSYMYMIAVYPILSVSLHTCNLHTGLS
jgi:hypothetical protein